jgi:hypothetical protein
MSIIIAILLCFASVAYADTSYSDLVRGPEGYGPPRVPISGSINNQFKITFSQDRNYNYYTFESTSTFSPSAYETWYGISNYGYRSISFYYLVTATNSIIWAALPENATSGKPYTVSVGWPPTINYTVDNNYLTFKKLNNLPYFVDWKGKMEKKEAWAKPVSFKPCFSLRVDRNYLSQNLNKNLEIGNVYIQYNVGIGGLSNYLIYGNYKVLLNHGYMQITKTTSM